MKIRVSITVGKTKYSVEKMSRLRDALGGYFNPPPTVELTRHNVITVTFEPQYTPEDIEALLQEKGYITGYIVGFLMASGLEPKGRSVDETYY